MSRKVTVTHVHAYIQKCRITTKPQLLVRSVTYNSEINKLIHVYTMLDQAGTL